MAPRRFGVEASAGPGPLHTLVQRLRARFERELAVPDCAVHETHISIVLLAGSRAFKFKKPVNLGFLDFSTLARRRHFCELEVELNRRFAPSLYEGVVGVTGSAREPVLDGAGEPFEFAVAMRRFDEQHRLDRIVESGKGTAADFTRFARDLASVHADAPPATHDTPFGTPRLVVEQIRGAFEHLDAVAGVGPVREAALARARGLGERIEQRRRTGRVRSCHGDLHLSNVVELDGRLTPFDCIEFDEALRVIDTMSDVAFLVMDLDVRAQSALANVFLDAYLSASGDYAGMALVRLYCAYRSAVRAAVAELQRPAAEAGRAAELVRRRERHIELARRYLDDSGRPPGLVITHGLSGSGKSRFSHALAERCGFVHVRSDIERRRLAGIGPSDASGSALGGGIYSSELTARTYERLVRICEEVLTAGFSVVADATFLARADRDRFRALAQRLGATFTIASFDAPVAVLRERIAARSAAGGDPSEATAAVLERQRRLVEPLAGPELDCRYDASHADVSAASPAALAVFGRRRPGSVDPGPSA